LKSVLQQISVKFTGGGKIARKRNRISKFCSFHANEEPQGKGEIETEGMNKRKNNKRRKYSRLLL
jgi:hypothetical protein